MQLFVDFHIHSRFARACSKDINIPNLEKWANIKGIDVLGTGDFTHPLWAKELEQELVEEKNGGIIQKQVFLLFIKQRSL